MSAGAVGAGRRDGRGRGPLLGLLAALALVVLVGAWLAAMTGGDVPAGATDASPSASPSAAEPTATPVAPWLSELVAELAERCGQETAAAAEPQLAALSPDEAEELADDIRETCEDQQDDDGGGGGDAGNGGNAGGGGNGGSGNDNAGGNGGDGNGGNGG